MKAALFSAISRLILGAALACGGSAMAIDNAVRFDAQARDRQARAACMKGHSDQNRVACLRKAEAAAAPARRERLDDREGVSPSTTVPSTGGPVEPAKCPAPWPPSRNTPGHDDPSETSRDGTCA
jgi:hypothetical protein